METKKINPSILEHRGSSYTLTELAKESKLSEIEKKIIKSRIKGDAFKELNESEVRLATDKLIFVGASIYGCPLPNTENFAEILSEQICIFINSFGYGHLTVSEMVLALHMNAAGVFRHGSGEVAERIEFSGMNFNVMFFAKIIELYRNMRNTLDRKFQNQIDGF